MVSKNVSLDFDAISGPVRIIEDCASDIINELTKTISFAEDYKKKNATEDAVISATARTRDRAKATVSQLPDVAHEFHTVLKKKSEELEAITSEAESELEKLEGEV